MQAPFVQTFGTGGHALPAGAQITFLRDQGRASLGAGLAVAGALAVPVQMNGQAIAGSQVPIGLQVSGMLLAPQRLVPGMQSPPQLPLEQTLGQTSAVHPGAVLVAGLGGQVVRAAAALSAGLAHAGALAHAAADVRAGHGVRDPLALGVAGLGGLFGPAVLAVRACTCRRRRPRCRLPGRSPSSPMRRRRCTPPRRRRCNGSRRHYRLGHPCRPGRDHHRAPGSGDRRVHAPPCPPPPFPRRFHLYRLRFRRPSSTSARTAATGSSRRLAPPAPSALSTLFGSYLFGSAQLTHPSATTKTMHPVDARGRRPTCSYRHHCGPPAAAHSSGKSEQR